MTAPQIRGTAARRQDENAGKAEKQAQAILPVDFLLPHGGAQQQDPQGFARHQ
jgi:hypothetical protein